MRQDHGKPTYIVKHFKLGVVEDEVHSGHFGKNGAIAQGVSHCSQPGTDLGKTCECKDKYIKIACYFTFSFGINFLTFLILSFTRNFLAKKNISYVFIRAPSCILNARNTQGTRPYQNHQPLKTFHEWNETVKI